MPTRDEAKVAACHLFNYGSMSLVARKAYARTILDYVNQPPEAPDADVWAEIERLLYGSPYNVFGFGYSNLGIDEPGTGVVVGALYDPRELLPRLRDLVGDASTLESETAARKAAEEKLTAAERKLGIAVKLRVVETRASEERVAGLERCVGISHEARKAAEEKLAAAEQRIAELETPVVLRQYRRLPDGDIYRVAFTPNPDGTHRIVWGSLVDQCWWKPSVRIGLNGTWMTQRKAQAALDKYAKEHDWREVKP